MGLLLKPSSVEALHLGFPKIRGTLLGSWDYSIVGSTLDSPYLGKLPFLLGLLPASRLGWRRAWQPPSPNESVSGPEPVDGDGANLYLCGSCREHRD